jgi:citrate lyase subunit beta/citryl-CoA lyase
MPGSNARALEKSRGLKADGLIFDLEDAVAPDAKSMARDAVGAAVAQGGYGQRELILRVNGLSSAWGHDDLTAAARMDIDGVLLPKVESADDVHEIQAALSAGGARANLPIWCMMETPRGILHAEAIAFSSPCVAALVMGTSDLINDLRAQHTGDRLPLVTSFGLCILAARAAGLAVLDGVHLDLSDDAGFAEVCRQGREFGFDGKTLIHPKTIEAANAAFSPSATEIEWSRRVIAAHEAAVAAGKGVVVVDGKLIEHLHVENARRVLALTSAIAQMGAALQ